jgi:hypothetical protein
MEWNFLRSHIRTWTKTSEILPSGAQTVEIIVLSCNFKNTEEIVKKNLPCVLECFNFGSSTFLWYGSAGNSNNSYNQTFFVLSPIQTGLADWRSSKNSSFFAFTHVWY